MLNIPEELKTIYKSDRIPIVPSLSAKELRLFFPELNLTIETDRIVDDSFELQESLCSGIDLTFGSCEGAILKVTVANLIQDLTGYEFTVTQIVNGTYEMPLGTYKVASCKKQNELWFREIVAYDSMTKTNVDVSNWYNSLTFPMTLATFRGNLLNYLGISEEIRMLPNDNMTVEKTIEPSVLSGRQLLQRCEEINGCFGHINRYGKFSHAVLEPSYGLYPSATLFPTVDLYPVSADDTSYFQAGSESVDISIPIREDIQFEEYTVKEIDKLQIRQEEGDIGAIVGTGTNAYIIEGNFFAFGKSAAELNTIAINAFGNMQKRPYRPFVCQSIGLPYIEVGDMVSFSQSDAVSGYVLSRTLNGIQALRDLFTAEGNEEIQQDFSLNTEIIQLQGKSNVLKRTVEEMSITITDMGAGLQSQITQTAGQLQTQITDNKNSLQSQITQTASGLQTQITDNKNNLQSQITQQAGQIELKVDAAGVIAAINISPGTVRIQGNKIDLVSQVVEIMGKIYLNIDDNDTAVFAVTSSGTTKVVSYQNITNPTGQSYQSVVVGDDSETLALKGYNTYMKGRYTTLYASISAELACGNGNYSVVGWNGTSFYPYSDSVSNLGNSTHYWNGGYILSLYSRNISQTSSFGTIGFYGANPTTKTSISTLSTSATLTDVINKVNSLISNSHGLWN